MRLLQAVDLLCLALLPCSRAEGRASRAPPCRPREASCVPGERKIQRVRVSLLSDVLEPVTDAIGLGGMQGQGDVKGLPTRGTCGQDLVK